MDISIAITIAGQTLAMLALLGGLVAWILRQVGRGDEESRKHADHADEVAQQWCRDVFASRTDLARVEERIKSIETALGDVRETAHEIRAMLMEARGGEKR